jgi:hypothetical protein
LALRKKRTEDYLLRAKGKLQLKTTCFVLSVGRLIAAGEWA